MSKSGLSEKNTVAMYLAFFLVTLFVLPGLVFSGTSFKRMNEPREHAFSILVPSGWKLSGGIFRVDPNKVGGPLNSMEAKCDLSFKKDSKGSVEFRIHPDVNYGIPGIGGGFFPPGSNYQGAQVTPYQDAPTFVRSLFATMRKNAAQVNYVAIKRLPGEIKSMNTGMAYMNNLLAQLGMAEMRFEADAAAGVIDYNEGSTRYREVILSGIVNMRGAYSWKNTRTLSFRAPLAQFDNWKPAMDIMRNSIQFNTQWFVREAQGQRDRAEVVRKTYEEIQRIDREIVKNTNMTRSKIMNDNYLVLTGQDEYVNPHTGRKELDTSAYKYRWVNPGGDVYYSDQEGENPNHILNRSGYKLTPVKK